MEEIKITEEMKKEEEMKEEEIKKMNIYEKMSLITEEIGVIEKGLVVSISKTNSYKAVSERDVLDGVKPIEKKYRVYSYPFEREIIDKDILVKESEYNGSISKTNTLFMRLKVVYRFINMDNPNEFIDITTYGDGLDTGDKAPGKAMTYADKYALMKAYKLSTGDDPDKEASPENGYKKATKQVGNAKISPKQIELIQKYYQGENLTKLLEVNNLDKLEDMSINKASEILSKLFAKKEDK